MSSLPSFLNKPDFFGKVLPGYIAILLYLFLFKTHLLDSSPPTSYDFLIAVVLIIAGPAIGFILWQTHRSLVTIIGFLITRLSMINVRNGVSKRREIQKTKEDGADKMKSHKESLESYARMRVSLEPGERIELNESEANYDFDVSTAMVFYLTSSYYFYVNCKIDFVFIILR